MGQVHRDLGKVVILDIPSHALDLFQFSGLIGPPARLPEIQGDSVGLVGGGQEIDIIGNKEEPRPCNRCPPFRDKLGRAEIRGPFFFHDFLWQPFILAFPDLGQGFAVFPACRGFIEIHRDAQFFGHPPSENL